MLLRKAFAGTVLILFSYLFWASYIYVLQNDLFYFHPWLDIPFHVAGGLLVGLIYYNIALRMGRDITRWSEALHLIGFVLAIGIGWEVFELIFGANKGESHTFLATAKDLVSDSVGALLTIGLGLLVSRPLSKRFGYEKRIKSKHNSDNE